MTDAFRLVLFGPPHLTRVGAMIHAFESRKALAMFAYLAVRDTAVPRRQLASLFWPDQLEARGRGNVRRIVSTLTVLLPDWLLVERHTVQFNPAMFSMVDVHVFTDLLAHGTMTALADATALYGGAFLDSVRLDDCPAAEEWLQQQRTRWQQQAITVLERLAEQHQIQHAFAAAIAMLERVVALDPWREEAHRSMMHLLAARGERDAALAYYHAYAQRRHATLGLAPADATVAVFAHLHRGDATRGVPLPRYAIPRPPTSLLGRAAELTQITRLLAQPECRLLTLTGPGGTGKTHLALAVLTDVLPRFADGVWFVDCALISAPALIAPTIIQVLGVPQRADTSPQQNLTTWLRDKRLLLCLDNFEHLLDAGPMINALLAACPRLNVLVTSRAALDLRGEQRFPIAPLPLPDVERIQLQRTHRVATLLESPAAALFVARARNVLPMFTLTDTDAVVMAAICVRLDGLPLAIELAAPLVQLFSLDALLSQLDQQLAVLAVGQRDHPARHAGMYATIDWSYQLLDAPTQVLFACLGVFVGGWTLADAEALSRAVQAPSTTRPYAVATGLAILLKHSLIYHQPDGPNGVRFAMLETVRAYAHEQVVLRGIDAAVQHHHFVLYQTLAQTAQPHVRHEGQSLWIARLATDQHNLRAALTWAYTHGAIADMLQMSIALRLFWLYHGHQREGQRWLEQGLAHAAAAHVPPAVQGYAWHAVGVLATWNMDFGHAQAAFEHSLAVFRVLDTVADRAQVQYDLGNALLMQGQYEDAERLLTQAMNLARTSNDMHKYHHAVARLGACAALRGDGATAIALAKTAMPWIRQQGDAYALALGLAFVGKAHIHMRDTLTANSCYREALQLFQTVGGRQFLSFPLLGLAHLNVAYGALHAAVTLLGAIAATHELLGITLVPALQPWHAQLVARLQTALSPDDYDQAWVHGARFTPEHAIAYALDTVQMHAELSPAYHATLPPVEEVAPVPARDHAIADTHEHLSSRELEVLRLMIDGASNHTMATALMISDATVKTHVAHILQKFGVRSRTLAIAHAHKLGLG